MLLYIQWCEIRNNNYNAYTACTCTCTFMQGEDGKYIAKDFTVFFFWYKIESQ